MKIEIGCTKCNFKVKADFEKGTYLTPEGLKSIAEFFGLTPTPTGYICKKCLGKQNKNKGEDEI